ncbi:DUF6480 family protein [Kitasatospora sp. DSM 101779]|uniref:DUF6480 family protein n=1 Tax=Kitasatospora sp. DSM 101779 TaxID=2853165 RepID=UPI0021DAE16F|nr:hypothetical protein [Kitasatospora sp. DSM 101779]MCU7826242.1 hypothetical protein [Kitasatospora sp. DSM 101779]
MSTTLPDRPEAHAPEARTPEAHAPQAHPSEVPSSARPVAPASAVGDARPEAPVPAVPPTETPECEASTCHGISLPEPVELHDAWPGLIPIALIAVLVIACAGFAVARIAAF